jgi:hypothetical protein
MGASKCQAKLQAVSMMLFPFISGFWKKNLFVTALRRPLLGNWQVERIISSLVTTSDSASWRRSKSQRFTTRMKTSNQCHKFHFAFSRHRVILRLFTSQTSLSPSLTCHCQSENHFAHLSSYADRKCQVLSTDCLSTTVAFSWRLFLKKNPC